MISIQTESSLFQAASEKLRALAEKSKSAKNHENNNSETSEKERWNLSLQKQVEAGEITPFEALEKRNQASNSTTFVQLLFLNLIS